MQANVDRKMKIHTWASCMSSRIGDAVRDAVTCTDSKCADPHAMHTSAKPIYLHQTTTPCDKIKKKYTLLFLWLSPHYRLQWEAETGSTRK